PRKYRIADVVIYAHEEPVEDLPPQLPLAVIEIVSPDDRQHELMKKLEEYRAWGVPYVWLVDPALPRIPRYQEGGPIPVSALEIPEFEALIAREEVLP